MDQLHQHGAFQNSLPFLVELVLCLDGQDSQEAPAEVSELAAQTFVCWHHWPSPTSGFVLLTSRGQRFISSLFKDLKWNWEIETCVVQCNYIVRRTVIPEYSRLPIPEIEFL